MNRTIRALLFISTLFLVLPSITAVMESAWYPGWSYFDSGKNANNTLNTQSNIAITSGQRIVFNSSFNLTGTNGFAQNSYPTLWTGNHDSTVAAWVYVVTGLGAGDFWWGSTHNSSVNAFNDFKAAVYGFQNGQAEMRIAGEGADFNGTWATGAWHHYCFSYASVNKTVQLFYDGSSVGVYTLSNTPQMQNPSLTVGAPSMGSRQGIVGYVDDFRVFNFTLTGQNCSKLYNSGAGYNLSLDGSAILFPAPVFNFSVQAMSIDNVTAVQTMSVYINTSVFNTTTGVVFTPIPLSPALYNMSILAPGYFNETYFNFNVSSNFTAYLTPNASMTNITNINSGMTSQPYITFDTTPIFNFSTSVNASCRISSQYQNYAQMGSNRTCSAAWENTTFHWCILTPQDAITTSNTYVYIACVHIYDANQTKWDTVGLQMQITNLAQNSSASIERGIQQSVIWPGATIYTNQQVYLRSATNVQILGIADKVAVSGNQRWIFHYYNETGNATGFFNITPVVYSLEIFNQTLFNIPGIVSGFINSTKQ